jgi:hypothetical protein
MSVLLPAPGTPVNADAQGAAAVGQEAAQHFLGLLKVGRGVALDEGDGPGQYGAIAGQHAGDVLVNGERPPRPPGGVGWSRIGGAQPVVATANPGDNARGEGVAGVVGGPVGFAGGISG